jgi:hypothetical protein
MTAKTESPDNPSVIGIDIGKDVFHLVGFDLNGQIVLRRKIKRLSVNAGAKAFPPYIEYQEKTSRQIPVFVAQPI